MKQKEISLTKWRHLPKRKKWWERRKLRLNAMGISNHCYDPIEKKGYSLQFYDYDIPYGVENYREKMKRDFEKILKIFPYDCILYRTKQGIQFISFSILRGYLYTKSKAVQTSKELGYQDYWSTSRDLVFRISPKWKISKLKKSRQEVSKKPKFLALLKEPNHKIISKNHLKFYQKYMNLPHWVYQKYKECEMRIFKIKIYHYKTRD